MLIYRVEEIRMSSIKFDNMFEVVAAGPDEARELETRALMMIALRNIIDDNEWSQEEAAARLGISQPRVSYLKSGKLDKFKIDLLVRMLARLGYTLAPKYENHRLSVDVRTAA
jgi:predicted XRE-type DNA-binding protein